MHVEARRDGPPWGTTTPYLVLSVVVVRGGDRHGEEFIYWRETVARSSTTAMAAAAERQAEKTKEAWDFISHIRSDD